MGIFDRLKKKAPRADAPAGPDEGKAAASEPGDAPRYRIADVQMTPLGDGHELVQLRGTEAARVVPEYLSGLLRRCGDFATLKEHAERLIEDGVLDPDERQTVHEDLETLRRQGLLVRADQARRRIAGKSGAAEGDAPRLRIDRVALVTANRVDLARRCLESWAEAERRVGRSSELVVFDDSRDAETRNAYRAMLERFGKETKKGARYAGREEKESYAEALTQELGAAGPDRAGIDFALFGAESASITAGANRNAVLLECAKAPVLSADDDTVWKAAGPPSEPDRKDRIALTSEYDPTEFWFYPDQTAAQAEASFLEEDLIAAHESLLGRNVCELVATSKEVDLDETSPSFLRRLESGRGWIALTNAGVVGDSGMGSTAYYLLRRGATRDRLVEDYERNHLTRAVFRSVLTPTVSEGSFLTMTSLGLDLRTTLPPFFPILRNTDGIFGVMLRVTAAEAYLGHLPFGVAHQPPERASTLKDLLRAVSATRCDEVVMAAIATCTFGPSAARTEASPALRFSALGRHLNELGALPGPELIELVRAHRSRRLAETSSFLEQSLFLYDEAPAAWAKDLRSMIEAIRTTLVDSTRFAPIDLLSEGDDGPAEAWRKVQRLLTRYGELLVAWTEIVDAAGRLASRGVRMTRPIAEEAP